MTRRKPEGMKLHICQSDNIIQRQKSVFTKLYVPINTESVKHRVEHIQTVSSLLKT